MAFFLIVYDQARGRVLSQRRFEDAEQGEALRARFELEREHRLDKHVEVVVLGARDEETLRATHARYFNTVTELIAKG